MGSPVTPTLSPGAALDEALHPLNATRNDMGSWSDTELAALRVAITQAKAACGARSPADFAGAALLDLARLCSLGQSWASVAEAAERYLAEPPATSPLRAQAYVAKIKAELYLRQEDAALRDSLAMLTGVPYTAEVADSVEETLEYLRFVYTADAVKLAQARQPFVLAGLRRSSRQTPPAAAGDAIAPTGAGSSATAGASGKSGAPGTFSAAPEKALPVARLFGEGLELARLQQLQGDAGAAAASVAALNAAMPPLLQADDAVPVEAERRRYALLGRPLPRLGIVAWLQQAGYKPPAIPAQRTITALLLFPDWCTQCRRLGGQLPETVFSVEGHSAYLYALLAETVAPRTPAKEPGEDVLDPKFAASAFAGTATLAVSSTTLQTFAANDFPFLVVTDAAGTVRVAQPVGMAALENGGPADSAIHRVGENFPLLYPTPDSPAQETPKFGARRPS